MVDYSKLKSYLSEMGGMVIGYSGGVDSTLLAKAATDALGEKALCVLIESVLNPKAEIEEAVELAEELGLNLVRMPVEALSVPEVRENGCERCYYCKKALFSKLVDLAKEHGLQWVCDGSNLDDSDAYRPGSKAIAELGVRSPLKELELTKEQIRAISRDIGLPTWNKPSFACLASRIPYGTPLTEETLSKIEKAESELRALGFTQFRVRHHGDTARIELMPMEMERITRQTMRVHIVTSLRKLGYTYVALDLAGYRSGSLDEVLICQETDEE